MMFGSYNHRFDMSKVRNMPGGSKRHNEIDFPEIYKYEVNMDNPLSTGEHIDTINRGAYPENISRLLVKFSYL